MTFVAIFKKGQPVLWHANAFKTDEERADWIVEGLDEREGIFPTYKVRNLVTGERGSAVQTELTAVYAKLRQ